MHVNKYNLPFNREEAVQILRVLDKWISICQLDCDTARDSLERRSAETEIRGVKYIKQRIELQANTKKQILNFKSSYGPFRSLFQMVRTTRNMIEKKLEEKLEEDLELKYKYEAKILSILIERLRRLPYIGQSEVFLKEGTNDLRDEFLNYWL